MILVLKAYDTLCEHLPQGDGGVYVDYAKDAGDASPSFSHYPVTGTSEDSVFSNVLCLECSSQSKRPALSASSLFETLDRQRPLHELRAKGIDGDALTHELSHVRVSDDGDVIFSNI